MTKTQEMLAYLVVVVLTTFAAVAGFVAVAHARDYSERAHKSFPAAIENCMQECFERELGRYMNKIYGTADQFVGQLKQVCEIRSKGRGCFVDGNGRYNFGGIK